MRDAGRRLADRLKIAEERTGLSSVTARALSGVRLPAAESQCERSAADRAVPPGVCRK